MWRCMPHSLGRKSCGRFVIVALVWYLWPAMNKSAAVLAAIDGELAGLKIVSFDPLENQPAETPIPQIADLLDGVTGDEPAIRASRSTLSDDAD